jgi:hypothetical protein
MGTEQPEVGVQEQVRLFLQDMASEYIGPTLAAHGCIASPAVIVQALEVAGVDIICMRLLAPPPSPVVENGEVPHETPARRYSVRANPGAGGDGAMATVSFRIPKAVKEIFDERVAELKDDEAEPGIINQTDAGQDAIVKWCLMEGK